MQWTAVSTETLTGQSKGGNCLQHAPSQMGHFHHTPPEAEDWQEGARRL